MNRPIPPFHLIDPLGAEDFVADQGIDAWARATFIEEGATVQNSDHAHLVEAKIGYVWTNVPNERKQRMVLGTCQLVTEAGDKWVAGRSRLQLEDWFGEVPDFVITLYAPEASAMDNASFMALVEHELYHAAPKLDQYGEPMFSRETGDPLFAIRGHDVEQFTGVVARYGAEATGVSRMVEAANHGAQIAPARVSIACGTCLRLVS